MPIRVKCPNCFSFRGEIDPDWEAPPLSIIYEFDNISDFLRDYAILPSPPFVELRNSAKGYSLPVADVDVPARITICRDCYYSENGGARKSETCSKKVRQCFVSGRKISLTQYQARISPNKKHSASDPHIHLRDILLDGKPTFLEVVRFGLTEERGTRLPLEVVPNVQPFQSETFSLRLMYALNDAWVSLGNKIEYIAEVYGISTSGLKSHISRSARHMREKQDEKRANNFVSNELREPSLLRTSSIEFLLNGEKLFAVFEFPSNKPKKGKLIEIYSAKELEYSKQRLSQILSTDQTMSMYLWDADTINQIVRLSQFAMDMKSSFSGLPPNIIYSLALAWKELSATISAQRFTTGPEMVKYIYEYVESALSPIAIKFVSNLVDEASESLTVDELEELGNRLLGIDFLDQIENVFPAARSLAYLCRSWKNSISQDDWIQFFCPDATEQQMKLAFAVIDRLAEEAASCSSVTTTEDIINLLFANQATLPISELPDELIEHTSIGTIRTAKLDSYGIELPCLSHLIDGGLLSNDPRRFPICALIQTGKLDLPDGFDCAKCSDCPKVRSQNT